jgi:hypothetical protein
MSRMFVPGPVDVADEVLQAQAKASHAAASQ